MKLSGLLLALAAIVVSATAQETTTNIWDLLDRTEEIVSNASRFAASSDIAAATSSLQVRLDSLASTATDSLNGHLSTLQDQTVVSFSGTIDSLALVTSNLNSLTGARLDTTAEDLTSLQESITANTDADVTAALASSRVLVSAAVAASWSMLQSTNKQLSTYVSQAQSDFDSEFSLLQANYASMSTSNGVVNSRVSASVSSMASIQTKAGSLLSILDLTEYGNPRSVVYRYGVWSTYNQRSGWYASNRADLFAGIYPSYWGDNNAVVWSITNNKDAWRTLFNKLGYGGYTTTVWAEEWYSYSSTNSRHVGTLFRVKNPTAAAISWTVNWYYSCYGGWNEYASVSLNGAGTFSQGGNCAYCTKTLTLSIPPLRTSTAIFVSASSSNSNTRTLYSGFYGDCLNLPDGLVFVDDMDSATGGWDS